MSKLSSIMRPPFVQSPPLAPVDGDPALEEYVPPSWIGAHVGLRLVDAFRMLAVVPVKGGPSSRMGFWPKTFADEDDHVVVWDELPEDERADLERRARRVPPSPRTLSQMEAALPWAGTYLAGDPETSRIVQKVAYGRSRDLDIEHVAKRMRFEPRALREINRRGLDRIATGLNQDRVPVF